MSLPWGRGTWAGAEHSESERDQRKGLGLYVHRKYMQRPWGKVSMMPFFFLFLSFFFGGGGHTCGIRTFPRLGLRSELQVQAYATTTTPDPSCICDLHHNLQQCHILNPVSKARDQTRTVMDTSQVLNPLSYNGNPSMVPLKTSGMA